MQEINFDNDTFADILARDKRYDAKAYTLLMEVFRNLCDSKDINYTMILDEFKELVLDQYGPMSYTLLTQWGLSESMDIGEMMVNLVESGRVGKSDNDNYEDFRDGYDFKEAFCRPYDAY